MRPGIFFCVMLLGTAAVSLSAEREPFNAGWLFTRGEPEGSGGAVAYDRVKPWLLGKETSEFEATHPYARAGFDDKGWRQLNLPHDWGIERGFSQPLPGESGRMAWWGTGWYRKHFTLTMSDEGKRIFLDLDGAMSYSTVWVNGKLAGGWPYGYTAFRVDLTELLKFSGENVVAVRLDNPNASSRWYPGSGLYRNVWLVKTGQSYLGKDGVQITTPRLSAGEVTVSVRAEAVSFSRPKTMQLRTRIFFQPEPGRMVAEHWSVKKEIIPDSEGSLTVSLSDELTLANPKLWSLDAPNLYVMETTLLCDGSEADTQTNVFGARAMEFDPDRGFLLNGSRVKIRGVCMHHDLGALGTAVNISALERQVRILREMGCNAIRTSHNPPAPELYELCDRMGMLLMPESFDCWERGKKPNDYARLWPDWHEKDLRAMVRGGRNHPSVMMWSVGNEIHEQENGEMVGHLRDIVRMEDTTRPVTAGCNNWHAGFNGFQKSTDVFGYNYKPTSYAEFHRRNPAIPVYGSETASAVSSRGEYYFPLTYKMDGGLANFQVSSYDLYAPAWASAPHTEFKGQEPDYVAGEFVWTGFDYIGEPTPYNMDSTNLLNFSDPAEKAKMAAQMEKLGKIKVPSRSSYFGIVDLAGFKKDRFYLYQSQWRPDLPMAHILPHWNWPERAGQATPVHVYTTGDEGELFLNGKSLGRKARDREFCRLRWDDVVYEPGELRVVTYRDGREWAVAVTRTAGAAEKITLLPDRLEINAADDELSFVTARIEDGRGDVVPRSNNRIKFSVSGPGEIVATDNGDATDLEKFGQPERRAFNGLALAIIRGKKGESGVIKVTAESGGLEAGMAEILTK